MDVDATTMPEDMPQGRWWHGLAGFGTRMAVGSFSRLPSPLAYGLADLLSLVLATYTVLSRRHFERKTRGFYRNVQIVHRGTLAKAKIRRLLFAWSRHMVHLAVDFCKMPQITAQNLTRHVEVEEVEKLRAILEEGRGVICVTGHIGFFELLGHVTCLRGMPSTLIFRPSPVPQITEILNRIRSSGGLELVPKEGALWALARVLRRGEITGIASDVSSKESEIYAPFLGTLAATNTTPGILHLKKKAPIAVVTCNRIGRQRFHFHVWEVIRHAPTGDRPADLQAIATAINDALSGAIRRYPEQWFWDSRRYRNRPPGEECGPDGLPPPCRAP